MSSSSDEFEPDWDPDPVGFNAEGEELEAARVAEEYLGSAAVAAGGRSRQGPPENLPIGTANFSQPRDTKLQRMDNAILRHYERMAGIAASSSGERLQEEVWSNADAFELAERWYMFAEAHPEHRLLWSLDAIEHSDDNNVLWMTK